ncbi:MAG: asparagine synthase-related protein [Eubacteriales bacterium]|nr:asparagine synthase-related protein [Eubacteriales bacterium]
MTEIRTYRGHIRNWKALCEELGIEGAGNLSRQDREQQILLRAYGRWGHEMGLHLHGMFALAIWDGDRQELFCLRDPFGTKPFYYAEAEDGTFLYGTMIREILAYPGFRKELNEDMLQIYLSLTYVAGEDTFFKGIRKLMPGRYLVWKPAGEKESASCTITRYFTPTFVPDESRTLEEWADEIHSTLRKIMPEVKEEGEQAESFLSGGVDSSYVLAMSDIKMTDSCGYEEQRFDESGLAKQTADFLGRENSRCLITPEEYFSVVPYVMKNMEQPLGDASAIAFAIACRETAKHTKLCYSGEGSDEFFGGYNMYRNAPRYGENLKNFYVGNTNIMKEDEKERILLRYNPENLPIHLVRDIYAETEGLDPLAKMSDVDIQIWLEGDIYLNVDKMSTAAGLEIRMPLTDLRIFDIASRMPSRFKVNAEQNKVAFRTAAAKVLPEEVAFRKKLGFIVPIRIWMADERYNGDVRRRLSGESCAKFFHMDEVQAIFEEYIGGNSDLWRKVWTIYTFLVWYDEYFA